MVNFTMMNEACHRITSTGLVKLIDYAYDAYPGKPGVTLTFTIIDEAPLLPVHIFPQEDEDAVWTCLQAADPIFTREMPNTIDALNFYKVNINRCLVNAGRSDEQARRRVACDITGHPAQIVFNIREKPVTAARR